MQIHGRDMAISAEEFVRLIQTEDPPALTGRCITGVVDLADVSIARSVVVRNVVFKGPVDWSQARLAHGADFTGCRFENGLILSDARIDGPLRLDDVVFGSAIEPKTDREIFRLIRDRLRGFPDKLRRWQQHLDEEKRKRALKAAAELENLRVAGCLSMKRSIVFGNLLLNHSTIDCELCVDGTVVHGNLALRHASLGEFSTLGTASASGKTLACRIDGGLDLSSSTIAGDLRLIGIRVGGELNLQAINIEGNLMCKAGEGLRARLRKGASLAAARVRGNADFGGARVDEGLDLGTSQIGGHLRCERVGKWPFSLKGELNMLSARIENSVLLNRSRLKGNTELAGARIGAHARFEGATLHGDISFENASLGGALLLRASADETTRKPCEIKGGAWLLGIKVAGDIDIGGLRIDGDLVLQNAEVGQNFLARVRGGLPSHLGGSAFLYGVRIRGVVELAGLTLLGTLILEGTSIDGNLIGSFDLIYHGTPRVVRSHIHGGVQAASTTIGKGVIFMGISIGHADHTAGSSSIGQQALSFIGAQISGELSFYSESRFSNLLDLRKDNPYLPPISEDEEKRLLLQAARERTIILGDLHLNRAHVAGDVLLDGVIVEGELDFRDADVRANINCSPIELEQDCLWASVNGANFGALDMTGDIHLTGLTIRGNQEDGSGGDLNLRDARVRGRLELYPLDQGEDPPEIPEEWRITFIRGTLRLDAAEISHVILSGRTFNSDESAPRKPSWHEWLRAVWNSEGSKILHLLGGGQTEKETPVRVGLERATLGRLQIVRPLPGTVDLSNLKVDRWDLPKDPASYRNMLENSHPFKRSNYLAIENALRNAGEDGQADEVHQWMRRRDRRSTKSFWKVLFDVFLDHSIRYGTTSKRLVCFMIVLFSISLWIFSNRNHVEYDIAPAVGTPPPVEHPLAWGAGDAALFATQLHVPIVSLGVKERVQPSGLGMRTYAMAIVAASWIMWPLLIASMSGVIRKRN